MMMFPLQSRVVSTKSANSTRGPILMSYGDGFLGALGTGGYENVLTPTPLPTTTELSVKEISVGWAHAGFVTSDGDAYIYGRTHSFRDVIRTTNMQRVLPKLVWWINSFTRARGVDTMEPALLELPDGERVKKIVCSTALTFLLTESGKLFTLGANSYGQCGIGEEGISVPLPTHVNIDGDEVIDIAAGYQHGLAVTRNGTVFCWGKGERGQLGFGTGNADAPQELIALRGKKITKVSAGFNHSCAVSEDGELYLWGKLLNPKGKIESNGDQITPRLVRTSEAVNLLQSSQFHSTFITADDKIWLVGRTPAGRQKKNESAYVASKMHPNPLQITNEQVVRTKDIVYIGQGVDKSSFVTANGRAFEWNFETGLHCVNDLANLRVMSLESGFYFRLLLAQPKE
ncbi:putative regulator of chromosome condensation 1/beta-lactamase-inhibitor protein II [Plasmopara halstedii]